MQVWLTHYDDITEVNRVYATFFDSRHYPARAAYEVSALPAGARVEIEAVAIVDTVMKFAMEGMAKLWYTLVYPTI